MSRRKRRSSRNLCASCGRTMMASPKKLREAVEDFLVEKTPGDFDGDRRLVTDPDRIESFVRGKPPEMLFNNEGMRIFDMYGPQEAFFELGDLASKYGYIAERINPAQIGFYKN